MKDTLKFLRRNIRKLANGGLCLRVIEARVTFMLLFADVTAMG